MSQKDDLDVTWHTGLFARPDSSFPKKCTNCGRVFETAEQYFTETRDINERDRGLKSYTEDETTTIVEAFRNCPCGSTLMEVFDDHREEFQAKVARKGAQNEEPAAADTIESDFGMEFTEMFADESSHGQWGDAWYEGLRPSADAFPKKCRNCGRVFETPDDFFTETVNINDEQTGLREAIEADALVRVEAYRNCSCGSTLMDHFADRRDMSPAGVARREKFRDMFEYLVRSGMDSGTAREELLKVVRGGKSRILANIKPPD